MAGLKLRRYRTAHRTSVEKTLSEVEEILNNGDDRLSKAVVIPYKLGLQSKLAKLTSVDEEILGKLCEGKDVTDEDLAFETEEANKLKK